MTSIFNLQHPVIIFILTLYVIIKQREDAGCSLTPKLEQHCFDENSKILKDCIPQTTDTRQNTLDKIICVFQSYKKVAIWRQCFIFGMFVSAILKYTAIPNMNWPNFTNILIISSMCAYGFQNYMNFHYYRKLDNIAVNLVAKLR